MTCISQNLWSVFVSQNFLISKWPNFWTGRRIGVFYKAKSIKMYLWFKIWISDLFLKFFLHDIVQYKVAAGRRKKRHLLEQVSGNESNRLDLSSKFFQGWWLFGVGTFRSNLRSCFNFFFEFFFCIISMVAWYGCRRENTKWENILNIFRAFQKNGSNYISKNSSYYTRCGRRTFLPVLRHLITLNLPDYCPIISRIKFWWFSFFLDLKSDVRFKS